MGTVFKKTVTKPLPTGAEIFSRKGLRLARWRDSKGKTRTARVTTGKDGSERITIESSTYYAKYRDGGRIVRVVPTGCKDETAARSVLADLERRAELVRANVITSNENEVANHQTTSLASHLAAFEAYLRAKNLTDVYRQNTRRYLDQLAAACEFLRLTDVRREAFEAWLVTKIDSGVSARTRNANQEALTAFCNWCVATKRMTSNPFKGMSKANVD